MNREAVSSVQTYISPYKLHCFFVYRKQATSAPLEFCLEIPRMIMYNS